MRSKKNFKSKKLTKPELQKAILNHLRKNPKKRFKPNRIIKNLKVKNSKDAVHDAMKDLANQGKIDHVIDDLFKFASGGPSDKGPKARITQQYITGRVDMIRSGAAYIVPGNGLPDIYVPKKYLKTAMNDDEVIIEVIQKRGMRKQEGKVVEIKKRASEKFVGIFERYGSFGTVEVLKKGVNLKIEVVGKHEAKDGDRVVIKVTHYGRNAVKGEIETVLSSGKMHDLEMNTILINEGFDIAFSEEVLKETSKGSGAIYISVSGRSSMSYATGKNL